MQVFRDGFSCLKLRFSDNQSEGEHIQKPLLCLFWRFTGSIILRSSSFKPFESTPLQNATGREVPEKGFHIPVSKHPTPESLVLRDVIQYLTACQIGTVIRNSVGMVMAGNGRPVRFGTPGQADVTVELSGDPRAVHVECKAHGGKLSDKQIAWLEAQRTRGNVCIVAYGVEDVYAGLIEAGFQVPKPSERPVAA